MFVEALSVSQTTFFWLAVDGWSGAEPGGARKTDKGSPQGGVISPLLANIYLDPLDQLLAARGIRSVRYADDIVILTDNGEAAQEALELVRGWMEGAQLTLHPDKTRVVDMGQPGSYLDFLGYRFQRSGKGKLMRLIRPKSKQKLRHTVKGWTRRTSGKCLPAIILGINPVLSGWGNYFCQALRGELLEMDQWVRMRLRSIDVQLLRILEEISAGRQESIADLRADLDAALPLIWGAPFTASSSVAVRPACLRRIP